MNMPIHRFLQAGICVAVILFGSIPVLPQSPCTPDEQKRAQSIGNRAAKLNLFDFDGRDKLNQQLINELSPSCLLFLSQLAQINQPAPPTPPRQKQPQSSGGGVTNHGGGRVSSGGVTCDPSSGCVGQ